MDPSKCKAYTASWESTFPMIGRAEHIGSSGSALGMVIPLLSDISTFSSVTLFQSKHWISDPRVRPSRRRASGAPGQALLPIPNGITGICPPPPPPPPCLWNLSGMKLVESCHSSGSLWMAQALTITMVFLGTWNPPMVQSSDDM